MDLLGFLLLLVVAAVAGACGELIAGGKVPGGMLGSMVAGLIGAWIGGMLVRVGPVLWGIQIIPAILGAAIFVLILRLLTSSRQRMT